MFRVDEKGKDPKVEELWQTRLMRNHYSSSVVHDGTIYGFDNATLKAISIEDGELTAHVDLGDGEEHQMGPAARHPILPSEG